MILSYIDPGSGSLILQSLVGGIAAVAVAGRIGLRRLRSMLLFWRRAKD